VDRRFKATQSSGLAEALHKVRPLTMVPPESLSELACQVRAILARSIPGDFVECGVWRGGASFLMAELLRQSGIGDRKVWLCDSFEGLPSPEEIDGPSALGRHASGSSRYDELISLEEVQDSARRLELDSYTRFVKGWFDQSLPLNRERIGPIAILRIDCDWHSSVSCCLEQLYDQVVAGGLIIVDDYFAYEGCAIAVHEFLGKRRLSHRIESVLEGWKGLQECQSALFRKHSKTWQEMKRDYLFQLSTQEIADFVPAHDTFILVDQDELGDNIGGSRRHLPYLEREGQYWGPPASDSAAIDELQRLRKVGANFIVFAWPAFWWLDYYSGLNQHLNSNYRCLLKNDRLVLFDLRT